MKTKSKAPLALTLVLGASLFTATPARADVKISDVEGWQFSTNGRVNAFLSYLNADGYPSHVMGQTHNFSAGAGLESNQLDNSNKINSFRLRSGFVGAVLGFTVKTQLDDANSIKAHIETWNSIETQGRQKAGANPSDVREAWGKVEGPWGSLLFGRALALFSRGAITLDYTYQHAYGLGYPCVIDGGGPTCGQVGYGVVFAGYNPQLTYSTPVFSGLQLSTGLFDPNIAPGKLVRTPLPRVESEATYDYAAAPDTKLHVFVNGMWQKLEEEGDPAMPSVTPLKTTSARAVNYGFWAELWKFRIGYSSHVGYGIGMNNALENTPVVFDSNNDPRKFDAYYGVLGLELGKVYLNVGAGITRLFATEQDKKDAQKSQQDPIKTQRGISGGINYKFSKNLIADVDYFNAKHTWYLGDTQSVNVLNAGLTIAW